MPLPESTASPGPVRSDQWGTTNIRTTFELMAAYTLTIDDSVLGQRGRVNAIFHPPPFSVRKV